MQTTSLRKAAVFLSSLPDDAAAQVIVRLPLPQVDAVRTEIAAGDDFTSEERCRVLEEFAVAAGRSCGDAARLDCEAAAGAGRHRRLAEIDASCLASLLADEHPQSIALVLSRLPAERGADVLAALVPELQLDVVRRVATLDQVSAQVIDDVEAVLVARAASMPAPAFEQIDGLTAAAELLGAAGRATERGLLEDMAHTAPELAEEIRRRLFSMPDLLRFSDADVQTILKNVETVPLAIALCGASEALQRKISANMSKRAGDLLREEMQQAGTVPPGVVEQTRHSIAETVRRLQDAGELHCDGGRPQPTSARC